jgi:hypothetical protein
MEFIPLVPIPTTSQNMAAKVEKWDGAMTILSRFIIGSLFLYTISFLSRYSYYY